MLETVSHILMGKGCWDISLYQSFEY